MSEKIIVLISQDAAFASIVERILNKKHRVLSFRGIHSAIDYIYNSIPDLVVMDIGEEDRLTVNVLKQFEGRSIFHQLPVLLALDETHSIPQWDAIFVEDYIK